MKGVTEQVDTAAILQHREQKAQAFATKLVYLFEMDSVRSTDEEVHAAHEALYDELVTNGNNVVLSFNQLTDSRAFLAILHDDDFFAFVQEQFAAGRMRFSRYKDFRSASQYVQNTIARNLDSTEDKFIYSTLPVKSNQKLLLALMQKVLVNDDIGIMSENIEKAKNHDETVLRLFPDQFEEYTRLARRAADPSAIGKEESLEDIRKVQLGLFDEVAGYLETLKRFLHFIITVSLSDAASNPAIDFSKVTEYDLMGTLQQVLHFQAGGKNAQLWQESATVLEDLLARFDEDEMKASGNNRSNWHAKLRQCRKRLDAETSLERDAFVGRLAALQMVELVIDLCHNYTIERSILDVSRHYLMSDEAFREEFFSRLDYEWQDGKEAHLRYLQPECNTYTPYLSSHINWAQAGRIIRRRNPAADEPAGVVSYECRYELQRDKKRKQDIKNILKALGLALVYVAAIVLVEQLMSAFENVAGDLVQVSIPLLQSILTFVIIMVVSGVVDAVAGLPDLSECFDMFKTGFSDIKAVVSKKPVAYVNAANFTNEQRDKNMPRKANGFAQSPSMKEYVKLYRNRKALFGGEDDPIQIVAPDEKGCAAISEYEATSNKKLGVVYKSPYNMLVVDLVKNKADDTSSLYTYERVVPTVERGAVVMLTKCGDTFLLLRQFRHAIRREQVCFPRGFAERGIAPLDNAKKELGEEMGVVPIGEPTFLGTVVADSGLSSNEVTVWLVEVDASVLTQPLVGGAVQEGVTEIVAMSEQALRKAVVEGDIDDGYTLSAFALYLASMTSVNAV